MAPLGDLLWIAALGGIFYFMMRRGEGCCGGHNHDDHHQANPEEHGDNNGHAQQQQLVDLKTQGCPVEQDPVCGMRINKTAPVHASEHFGRTFHFCSEQCQKLFDINPGKYAGSA